MAASGFFFAPDRRAAVLLCGAMTRSRRLWSELRALDTPLARREFLTGTARAALGAAALSSVPAWAYRALAAAAAPDIIERNDWPEHWESTIAALGRSPITPNDVFFARSHFPVPKVDSTTWKLEVTGLVNTPLSLTLDELRAMETTDLTCVLECAGNGRGLMKLPGTSGTQWEYGAVGNAAWAGPRLSVLLARAGVKSEAQHVWFEAMDFAPMPATPPFVRSIPIAKANADVMLAHSMNGAALTPLHGAPLRAVVPGWFGMASTKWIARVRVEAEPSSNHFMVKGYRYVEPGGDPAASPPVEDLRVKSLITRPLEGARVAPGTMRVHGYAWAGASGVKLVEVSIDRGTTWKAAGFSGDATPYAWRQWSTEFAIKTPKKVTLMARATDGAGNVQPLEAKINVAGYGNNSIHRVSVDVRA